MTPLDDVLTRAQAFFMKSSAVHVAASRIAKELNALGIPYAIAGGLAVGMHGHERVTDNVDVLLTAEGWQGFEQAWLGRGWERSQGSRSMRDTVVDVPVDVLLTGDFPGDGKPKPVAFPDPAEAAEFDPRYGYPVIRLERLIELKLASGMDLVSRLRDLADVVDLIRKRRLPRDLGEQLNPWVRAKYEALWDGIAAEAE